MFIDGGQRGAVEDWWCLGLLRVSVWDCVHYPGVFFSVLL